MGYRVGVDIGGTFTDFCVFHEETGLLKTLKVLSRPDEPGAEVTTGLNIISIRAKTNGSNRNIPIPFGIVKNDLINLLIFPSGLFLTTLKIGIRNNEYWNKFHRNHK